MVLGGLRKARILRERRGRKNKEQLNPKVLFVSPSALGSGTAGSDGLGGLGEGGMEFVGFDVPGQAYETQGGDAVPVGVDLVPGEAVARGLRMGVVVVVPAFAEGWATRRVESSGALSGFTARYICLPYTAIVIRNR
jgi:hypothetical protein